MFDFFFKETEEDLGLGAPPGSNHYRAYVGPPSDYDLVTAMVFNITTCMGLRQHHKFIDVGCGSIRLGRVLIPYLNRGNYFGVEPNRWLVKEGIKKEIGRDLLRIKSPTFFFSDTLRNVKDSLQADFAVAQSIFSHCGIDLIEGWLSDLAYHLSDNGALLATFLMDDQDFKGSGWIYPGCVKFTVPTMEAVAAKHNFDFQLLDWYHPRQSWALFSKPGFDSERYKDGVVSWNKLMGAGN